MIRPQDIVWLLLFGALLLASPVRNSAEMEVLIVLALFQVLSPRVAWFATPAGNLVSIATKLLLGWLLIGVTYGLESSYYLILLLPVVSSATTLSAAGTIVVTLAAAGAYLSFLFFLDWTRYTVPAEQIRELSLRVLFLPLVGYLTYELAKANRLEARKYQTTAEQLADANRSLRDAEVYLRRADRLAALGQLTAGLAHELRNPLGTIKNSSELLSRRIPKDDPVARELAGYISAEVDRTNTLISRFLDFARPFSLRMDTVQISSVVDKAIEHFERRNPLANVSVFRNYSPDVRPMAMDAELMEQVFLNLITNAAEASPPAGIVTVKTRALDGGIEISVIDRGPGIDPKHRENIFNPFFTTKQDGVGLGLAIVSKIVDEHGGKVLVDSAPGEGSIFCVWLPLPSENA